MQYWGKIIGVAFAIIMGAGFWGVVLGLIIGHMFDKARSRKMAWFANQRERQSLFFSTTFEVMGHLTKSKGRVTEADIQVASVFMDRMNLHGESRIAAQNAFRIGKSDNYPLREKMRQFRSICFGRFDLIRMFLEIQIQAAFADGSLHPNERERFICDCRRAGHFPHAVRPVPAYDAGRRAVWRWLSATALLRRLAAGAAWPHA